MTTTMTDLRDGRTYVFNEALPGRDAYEDALALGFEGTRAAWLATLRGFAFDPASADWEVDRPYAVNAAIRHQHKIWVAKVAHEGVTPGTDPEVWQLLLDGASALELSNAVAAALAHQGAAETAAGLAEAKRAAAAAILNATLDAAAALTPIDALHPVSLPIPAGWWDTGDRLLSGASERAIICNWAHEILAPAALWRGTLPASLRAATDGTGEAAVGGAIARINDSSGNALHLTQASTSLRPIRGRRPKTGARNRIPNTTNIALYTASNTTIVTLPGERLGHDMARVTATAVAGYVNCGLGYPPLLTSDVAVSVEARAGTATTATLYIGGGGNNFGVQFDLTTGALMSGPTSRIKSTAAVDLGDGWWRLTLVSDSLASNPAALLVHSSDPGIVGKYFDVGRAQVEQASEASPYQKMSSNGNDIAEDGVESVSFTRFDLVDDALTTGAIAGGLTGQAFVAGDGGCYVSDLVVAAGGTFSIGGTTLNWTGAAPGILRAVTGDTGRVLDAMMRAGTYTEDEIARLERYYRALGGKGLLVPGPELVVNSGFDTASNWTLGAGATISGGVGVLGEAINARFEQAVSGRFVAGHYYLFELDIPTHPSYPLSVEVLTASGWTAPVGTSISVWGVTKRIFKAPADVSGAGAFRAIRYAATASYNLNSISVRRLIPREDL